MNRKLTSIIIISILLTILLSSCEALLNPASLFSALDKPDTGAISKMTGTDLLEALEEQDGSSTFYEELSDSEAARIDAELARLEQSGDQAKASEAALARVELTVMTNPVVRDTVNSIADLLIQDDNAGMNTAEIVGKLTAALDPIKNDPDALEEFLRDMSTISNSYGNVKSSDDVGPGDLQTFMVAAVFATIDEIFSSTGVAADALSDYLTTPNDDITVLLADSDEDVTEGEFQDMITDTGEIITTLDTLARLSGLEVLADSITDALGGDSTI